jgi:hypothetical protein
MSNKAVYGTVGFVILILAVWGVAHWQAEPGAKIGFGFIGYTKPGSKTLTAHDLAYKLAERVSGTHKLTLGYTEPCGELTLTDTTGKFARFEIRNATTLWRQTQQGSGRWVIETSEPKHSVALATRVEPSYEVDKPVDGSALSLFERLKAECLSEN